MLSDEHTPFDPEMDVDQIYRFPIDNEKMGRYESSWKDLSGNCNLTTHFSISIPRHTTIYKG